MKGRNTEIKHYHIREVHENGEIDLEHTSTAEVTGDIMTKALPV
jgi:hypothetical protein